MATETPQRPDFPGPLASIGLILLAVLGVAMILWGSSLEKPFDIGVPVLGGILVGGSLSISKRLSGQPGLVALIVAGVVGVVCFLLSTRPDLSVLRIFGGLLVGIPVGLLWDKIARR